MSSTGVFPTPIIPDHRKRLHPSRVPGRGMSLTKSRLVGHSPYIVVVVIVVSSFLWATPVSLECIASPTGTHLANFHLISIVSHGFSVRAKQPPVLCHAKWGALPHICRHSEPPRSRHGCGWNGRKDKSPLENSPRKVEKRPTREAQLRFRAEKGSSLDPPELSIDGLLGIHKRVASCIIGSAMWSL